MSAKITAEQRAAFAAVGAIGGRTAKGAAKARDPAMCRRAAYLSHKARRRNKRRKAGRNGK